MSNRIRQPAPGFSAEAVMPDGSFKTVSLGDYKGKWLVLFFYPLDFTFVCPTEICQYSDRAQEFKDIDCEVVGASVDSKFSHLAWTKMERKKGGLGKMDIPLLADLTKQISRDYGVLIEDEKDGDCGVAFRGIFIIDPAQNLRQITINDLPVGRNVDETLRLVQGFQYNAKHGEVVPCGWKPGKKTMNADPKKSMDYFSTVENKE